MSGRGFGAQRSPDAAGERYGADYSAEMLKQQVRTGCRYSAKGSDAAAVVQQLSLTAQPRLAPRQFALVGATLMGNVSEEGGDSTPCNLYKCGGRRSAALRALVAQLTMLESSVIVTNSSLS